VAQQQLLHHQPGLNRLAEADIVGDEEVHTRHRQGPRDRLELVLLDRDAGPEGCLQRAGVRAGDRAPADRIKKGTQPLRIVPPVRPHRRELSRRNDLPPRFHLPHQAQLLAEIVVADARKRDQSATGKACRRQLVDRLRAAVDVCDDPLLTAHPNKLAGLWPVCRRVLHAPPLR